MRIVLTLAAVSLLAGQAHAGLLYYGITGDNKIVEVDPVALTETEIFDTGLSGNSNGMAIDVDANVLVYRNPETGGDLYAYDLTSGTQTIFGGVALPGDTRNAAIFGDAYWFINEGTDDLVRADLDLSNPLTPTVTSVTTFPDFDGTSASNFGFNGDIAINDQGILYGTSTEGFFSVDVSGSAPTNYNLISNLSSRQIAFSEDQSFLFAHHFGSGEWSTLTLDGIETPIADGSSTFTTAGLRDITGAPVPEPTSIAMLALGGVGIAVGLVRRKTAG